MLGGSAKKSKETKVLKGGPNPSGNRSAATSSNGATTINQLSAINKRTSHMDQSSYEILVDNFIEYYRNSTQIQNEELPHKKEAKSIENRICKSSNIEEFTLAKLNENDTSLCKQGSSSRGPP